MATTNKNKLTTFKSGQTIVTSDFMNSLYQAPNGETASGNEAYGHVHDGSRLDGHAQKINLSNHVDGLLDPEKIDGNLLSQIGLSSSGTGTITGDALVEPDGPTGSVTLVAGNGIEIEADAEARTVTFKTAAEAITYTLSSITTAGGAGIRLTSDGVNQDVLIKQGSNVTVTKNLAEEIVIAAANTTYSISGQTVEGGALVRLTSSTAVNDDLKLESGTNVTVQRISADVIRISAQVPAVPLTTKGDILVRDVSVNVRLPVGTAGQVLSVNPNTTTGLQWVNALTLPTTTAGDLIVHNGTGNIRLPVGSNGQYLKVNTSLAAKVEWGSIQGGSGDVVGPATATDNAIARYNSGTGKLIQNSLVTIDDEGTLTGTIVRVGDDNSAGNIIIGDGTATTWSMMTTRGPNTSYRGVRIDNNTTEIWFAGSPNDGNGNYVLRSGGNANVVTVTAAGNMFVSGDLTVTGNDIKSSSATALTLSGADVAVAGGLTVTGDLTVTGNDIKSSSGTPITLSGTNVSVAGNLTVVGNNINSSTETAIMLSGSDVAVVGELTVIKNTINSSSAEAITLSGANVNIVGDLTVTGNDINSSSANVVTFSGANSSFKGNITTLHEVYGSTISYQRLKGPQTVLKYTDEIGFKASLGGADGRYYIGAPGNGITFTADMPGVTSGSGLSYRVITIANAGLGLIKVNVSNSDLFIVPFYNAGIAQLELSAGEWVELIAKPGTAPVTGLWIVVCGGTMPDYKPSNIVVPN